MIGLKKMTYLKVIQSKNDYPTEMRLRQGDDTIVFCLIFQLLINIWFKSNLNQSPILTFSFEPFFTYKKMFWVEKYCQ